MDQETLTQIIDQLQRSAEDGEPIVLVPLNEHGEQMEHGAVTSWTPPPQGRRLN